jgi:hypothetical protein
MVRNIWGKHGFFNALKNRSQQAIGGRHENGLDKVRQCLFPFQLVLGFIEVFQCLFVTLEHGMMCGCTQVISLEKPRRPLMNAGKNQADVSTKAGNGELCTR